MARRLGGRELAPVRSRHVGGWVRARRGGVDSRWAKLSGRGVSGGLGDLGGLEPGRGCGVGLTARRISMPVQEWPILFPLQEAMVSNQYSADTCTTGSSSSNSACRGCSPVIALHNEKAGKVAGMAWRRAWQAGQRREWAESEWTALANPCWRQTRAKPRQSWRGWAVNHKIRGREAHSVRCLALASSTTPWFLRVAEILVAGCRFVQRTRARVSQERKEA